MEHAAQTPIGKLQATNKESVADAPTSPRSKLPRVTGVRHWSTPDYTRVAIDIEQDVTFDSQRIAHPDRIFFDLRGTKLASTLVGKTFDVDDGFLKKIRVAEFEPGRTRIVLEVDHLSSYNAFLLPDPYRLIIDVHGKQTRATLVAKANPPANAGSASEVDLGVDDDAGNSVADNPPAAKGPEEAEQKPAKTSVKIVRSRLHYINRPIRINRVSAFNLRKIIILGKCGFWKKKKTKNEKEEANQSPNHKSIINREPSAVNRQNGTSSLRPVEP